MSESEHLPGGKSEEDLAIEAFVDSIEEIHPNLDREQFHETISGYVQDAVAASDDEEGGSEDEE